MQILYTGGIELAARIYTRILCKVLDRLLANGSYRAMVL
jgi:hypothetical protein